MWKRRRIRGGKEIGKKKKHTITQLHRQTLTQSLLTLFNRLMKLAYHAVDVAALEFVQQVGGVMVDFVEGVGAVVDAGKEIVVTLVLLRVEFFEQGEGFGDAVVDDLDAVVEVGELVGLRADAGGEDVVEEVGGSLLLLCLLGLLLLMLLVLLLLGVGLLLVTLLGSEVLLLLVLRGASLDGLFARVRIRGRDDEAVDFERVGVFGARCADAKEVAFGEFNLGWSISMWVCWGRPSRTDLVGFEARRAIYNDF